MAKKEAQTGIWVHDLSKSANITLEYQASTIAEIDKALKTVSKADTGKACKPEFIGFEFVASNHVTSLQKEGIDKYYLFMLPIISRLSEKDSFNRGINNKYTLLYLSNAIAQQRGKYAYSYQFNAQRMKRQIIMLPSQADSTPGYAYIKQTMRTMKYCILHDYFLSIK